MKVDPIKFEVLRNGFLEATEEMALALRRSAYSTNIKTRCDFSCSLFDRDLRPIAQSFSQPNHLGSMVGTVRQAVLEYGSENLGPGDHLVVNYPYPSGAHLNDIVVVAPFHYEGEIQGYFGNLAHHVDVGGGAPASVGAFREIYQEGVIIPPVKIVQAGKIVDDIFRLVLAQIRSKRETAGDFRAQFAANNTGVRRLTALFDRYGPETVNFYMDELIAYTDRRTQAELAGLPKGEYVAEGYVDNDGFTDQPVRLAVRVLVDDDGVLFDFTGSDPQRRAPVNSTWAQTYSAAAYALKCVADPDLPVNEGFYRHVRMVAPEGTATQPELQRLLRTIATRVIRALEGQGLLIRDDETPSLDLEPDDGFEQLLGAAVHYRIAVGPHAGRKALTSNTVRGVAARCASSRASRLPRSSRRSSPISPPATPAASVCSGGVVAGTVGRCSSKAMSACSTLAVNSTRRRGADDGRVPVRRHVVLGGSDRSVPSRRIDDRAADARNRPRRRVAAALVGHIAARGFGDPASGGLRDDWCRPVRGRPGERVIPFDAVGRVSRRRHLDPHGGVQVGLRCTRPTCPGLSLGVETEPLPVFALHGMKHPSVLLSSHRPTFVDLFGNGP